MEVQRAKGGCFVQILHSLGVPIVMPIIINCDNMGSIFMAENAASNQRTRHIHVRHRFVVDLVEEGLIEVIFVRSENNLADGQTKNVTSDICDVHTRTYLIDRKDIIKR